MNLLIFMMMTAFGPGPAITAQPLSFDEMQEVKGGELTIECDECTINTNTGIATCRGCRIILK